MDRYDAVIIGSGPAGLEAAVNLHIRNKRFLLFGTPELSRKLSSAPRIDNYLGLPGISGEELGRRFTAHIGELGIEVRPEQIQMVYPMGGYFSLASAGSAYEAVTVILATGVSSSKLLDGEERFLGKGVGYCATCDAPLYRGKTVAVLGYTDEAAREADYVAELAEKVYYIPMKKTGIMPGTPVEILTGAVGGIAGNSHVQCILLDGRAIAVDGVFLLRDTVAPASLVPGIQLEDGFVKVDAGMATNLAGCFAAGDCTGKPHQYMRAAGQGQIAALSAAAYLDAMK